MEMTGYAQWLNYRRQLQKRDYDNLINDINKVGEGHDMKLSEIKTNAGYKVKVETRHPGEKEYKMLASVEFDSNYAMKSNTYRTIGRFDLYEKVILNMIEL
jgi:hypothetical protein